MKRPIVLSCCLLAAAIWFARAEAASGAPAQSERPTPQAIEQMERDRQDAFIRGDADALDRATADAYTTVSPSGVFADKAQMMKNIRARKTRVLSVTLEDLAARVYGDTAVLTGIYRDTHVTDGQTSQANSRFIRVFSRTPAGWQAVAYQQTALPSR
jgi:ketosteroid isomerase-like protein